MRKTVLLPEPEGPTSTTNSWSLTVRLISCTTSTLPKYLLMCSKRTLAIVDYSFSRSRRYRHRSGHACLLSSSSYLCAHHTNLHKGAFDDRITSFCICHLHRDNRCPNLT